MKYNWQYNKWPDFTYSVADPDKYLLRFVEKTGYLSGLFKGLQEDVRLESVIEVMVQEAMKTSEIEGENLSRTDVYSSIKKNLGLIPPKKNIPDKRALGIGELIILIHNTYMQPLSRKMLFNWHQILMKGNRKINPGQWRSHNEPMQVVSGTVGKEVIHFEAAPSEAVPQEMENFISWFNYTAPGESAAIENPLIRSAIAHVYFETIHPFEDGNGRIGRFLSEKILSQGLNIPVVISLSKIIEQNKKQYYNALKEAQRTLDLTKWINYFTNVILTAQSDTEKQIEFTLNKIRFFDQFKNLVNERQRKVINKMLEAGPEGFSGGMNAKKYMSITKISKATATRDLQFLSDNDILIREGGGRSSRYRVSI